MKEREKEMTRQRETEESNGGTERERKEKDGDREICGRTERGASYVINHGVIFVVCGGSPPVINDTAL